MRIRSNYSAELTSLLISYFSHQISFILSYYTSKPKCIGIVQAASNSYSDKEGAVRTCGLCLKAATEGLAELRSAVKISKSKTYANLYARSSATRRTQLGGRPGT